MRINHNISSMVTQSSLFKVDTDLGKSLEKLSTGLRINRASDDAAGLAISENLRTQVRGAAQARRNALDGIAAINIAEGAAGEITDILQRMRELAIQSANDTLTSTERSYTNQEFAALEDEIDRIARVTNYNGMEMISSSNGRFGYSTDPANMWIDANGDVNVDSLEITTATLTTVDAGSGANAGLGVRDLTLVSQTDSAAAINNLDIAIGSVNTMRADLGAYVNRLETAVNKLMVDEANQQAAESQIRDVDFATETSHFTRSQILMQSATSMLAQSNMKANVVLSLLQ